MRTVNPINIAPKVNTVTVSSDICYRSNVKLQGNTVQHVKYHEYVCIQHTIFNLLLGILQITHLNHRKKGFHNSFRIRLYPSANLFYIYPLEVRQTLTVAWEGRMSPPGLSHRSLAEMTLDNMLQEIIITPKTRLNLANSRKTKIKTLSSLQFQEKKIYPTVFILKIKVHTA